MAGGMRLGHNSRQPGNEIQPRNTRLSRSSWRRQKPHEMDQTKEPWERKNLLHPERGGRGKPGGTIKGIKFCKGDRARIGLLLGLEKLN